MNPDKIFNPWKHVLPILQGGWGMCDQASKRWKPPSKNLLIFVSSTFTDSHLERDILIEQILPYLQERAQKHGILVTLTDMRYGVIEANQRNHRVWDYCKAELNRCHRDSAGIFFLSLQGNKYGYCPIPRTIEKTIFEERVISVMLDCPEALEILQRWYFLDMNADPPLYSLKYIANATEDKLFWQDFVILQQVLAEISFDADDPNISVGQSITEWETRFAIKLCDRNADSSESNKRKIWIHREFLLEQLNSSSDPSRSCADFYDDVRIQESLSTLLEYMNLNFDHCIEIECPSVVEYLAYGSDASCQCSKLLSSGSELGNYGKKWGESVKKIMLEFLDEAILRRKDWKSIPGVEYIEEMIHHAEWAILKAEDFVGREQLVYELLDAISLSDIYVSQSKALTCAVIGPSGCGKTALMAKVAQLAYLREVNESNASNEPNQIEVEPGARYTSMRETRPVIVRFCGTSPDSSDAFSLIRSICLQLSLIFNQPTDWHFSTSVTDYSAAVQHFQHLLQINAVILFIDSLDQLSDAYQGRSRLTFLSSFQPHPDTRIIVSSLPDEMDAVSGEWIYCYQCESRLKEWQVPILEVRCLGLELAPIRREDAMMRARSDGSQSNSVVLGDLSFLSNNVFWDSEECETMLRIILNKKYSRICSPQQMNYVLRQAAEEPSVLYLQLASRVIANWTSEDIGVELASGVTALIYQIFSCLETEYGVAVTRAALGFLTFSKSGVTDNEMQNLLTLHRGVIEEVDVFHTMRRPRLPFHVWARLRSALEGLIVEKQDGCLRWYHRQLQETAERRYAMDDSSNSHGSSSKTNSNPNQEKLELHYTMACYFGNAIQEEERKLKLVAEQPLLWVLHFHPHSDSVSSENDAGFETTISSSANNSAVWISAGDLRINRRRCLEASFHLTACAEWILQHNPDTSEAKRIMELMISELCQPAYVCAVSKASNLVGFLQDLRNLRTAILPFQQISMVLRIRLDQYIRWIRMYIGALTKDPDSQIPYSLSEMAEEYTELGKDYENLLQERLAMTKTLGPKEAPLAISKQLSILDENSLATNLAIINSTAGLTGTSTFFPTMMGSMSQSSFSGKGWVFPVIWKVERSVSSARPEMTLSGCKEHIMAITASPTHSQVAVSYQGGVIEIWDIEVGSCSIVMEGASSLHGTWLSYTGDGKKLISLVVGWFKMGYLEVWDAGIGYRLLYHHDIRLSGGLVCTPDHRYAIVGCKDGMVEMRSMRNGSCKRSFSTLDNSSSAVSCLAGYEMTVLTDHSEQLLNEENVDSKQSTAIKQFFLAIGYENGNISIWNSSLHTHVCILTGYDRQPIRVMHFSHNGQRLTSSSSPSTASLAWSDQSASMSILRIWIGSGDNSKISQKNSESNIPSIWTNPKRLQEVVVQGTCISLTYSKTPRDRILVTLENDLIVCRDADTCEQVSSVTAVTQVNLLCGNCQNGAYVTTTDDGEYIHVWSPDIHLDYDDSLRTPGRVAPLSHSLSRTWSSASGLHFPQISRTSSFLVNNSTSMQQTSKLLRKKSDHNLHRYQSERSLYRMMSEKSLFRLNSDRSMPRLSSDRSLTRFGSEYRPGSRFGSFVQRNGGVVDLTALDTFTIPEVRDQDGASLEYISSSDEEEDDSDSSRKNGTWNKRELSSGNRDISNILKSPPSTLQLISRKSSINVLSKLRYTKSMPAIKEDLHRSALLQDSHISSSTTYGIDSISDSGGIVSSVDMSMRDMNKTGFDEVESAGDQDPDDRIDALCIHPEGKYVAVARHQDSHITFWSLDGKILIGVLPDSLSISGNTAVTNEMVEELSGLSRKSDQFRVIFLRFLNKGSRLLIGLHCGLFVIWHFENACFEHAARFREMCNPRFIVISPDDRHLIPNFYAVWNMVTGKIVHRPQENLEYKVAVFSSKGDKALLICAKETGSLIVYDARQVLVLLDLAVDYNLDVISAAPLAEERASTEGATVSEKEVASVTRRPNITPLQIQQLTQMDAGSFAYSKIVSASYDTLDYFGVREIVHACFAPDGNSIALLNNLKDIWLATTSSMEILQHIRLNDFAVEVYFTLDGAFIMATYSHIGQIHGFEVSPHSKVTANERLQTQSIVSALPHTSASWNCHSFQHYRPSPSLPQSASFSFPSPGNSNSVQFFQPGTPLSSSGTHPGLPYQNSLAGSSPRHQELWKRHPRVAVMSQPTWELSLPNTVGGEPNTVQKILPLSKQYLLLITVSEEIMLYEMCSEEAESGVNRFLDSMDEDGSVVLGQHTIDEDDDLLSTSSTAAAVYSSTSCASLSSSFFYSLPSNVTATSPSISRTSSSMSISHTGSSPRLSSQSSQRVFPAFPIPSPSAKNESRQITLPRAASCDGIGLLNHQTQFPAIPPIPTPRRAVTATLGTISNNLDPLENKITRTPRSAMLLTPLETFNEQDDATECDPVSILSQAGPLREVSRSSPSVRPPLHSLSSSNALLNSISPHCSFDEHALPPTNGVTVTDSSASAASTLQSAARVSSYFSLPQGLDAAVSLPSALSASSIDRILSSGHPKSLAQLPAVSPRLVVRVPMLSRGELRAVSLSMHLDLMYCFTSGQAARIFGLENVNSTSATQPSLNPTLFGNSLVKLTVEEQEYLSRRGDLLSFYRR
jgi:hypothetical protein